MRKTGQIFLTEKFQIINIKGMREIKNNHKNSSVIILTGN